MYLHDPTHSSKSGTATAVTTSNAGTLVQAWTWTPPTVAGRGAPSLQGSPTVYNGVVYIGTGAGHLYAIDETTGEQRWDKDLGYSQSCPTKHPDTIYGQSDTATVAIDPVSGNPQIYIASGPPGGGTGGIDLLAVNLDGSTLWRKAVDRQTGSYPWSSPVVTAGHIYVGIASNGDCPLVRGGIKEYDQHSGALLHRYWATPSGTVGAGVWTTPATDGHYLWATTGNGNYGDAFRMVRLYPGLARVESWRVPGVGGTDLDFGASPTLFGAYINGIWTPLVGAADKNGYFYAFRTLNVASGPIWSRKIGYRPLSAAVWDGSNKRLYVTGDRTTIGGVSYPGSIRRLSPATGGIVWQKGLSGRVVGTATLDGAGVIAVPIYDTTTSSNNNAALLQASTGITLATLSENGSATFAQPVFADNVILVASSGGGLIAYHPA